MDETALVLWPHEKSSAGELPHPLWSLSSVLSSKGSLMGMALNKYTVQEAADLKFAVTGQI